MDFFSPTLKSRLFLVRFVFFTKESSLLVLKLGGLCPLSETLKRLWPPT